MLPCFRSIPLRAWCPVNFHHLIQICYVIIACDLLLNLTGNLMDDFCGVEHQSVKLNFLA
ncbi:hypothetical protein Scep_026845 [Stephania cephalantha]|uniref:Uncharacterized protein n=1 Tax=Stephania cephalantha TaxID=152367 RepID=A0AAP0EKX4_9MAGN